MTDWNEELQKAMKATAVIRKYGSKSKPYCIYSKSGKKLGCYPTRKQAEKRLAQIEMFKHMKDD
jgi:hypothetical protein